MYGAVANIPSATARPFVSTPQVGSVVEVVMTGTGMTDMVTVSEREIQPLPPMT